MNINDTVKKVTDTATEKGWSFTEKDIPEKIALCHSELSEALEEYRAGHLPSDIYNDAQSLKPEGFGIELADCVIRIMHLCGQLNIDLENALEIKMTYNDTRSFRHGGKKA